MKNVLVISYSQSGQLDDIITNFLRPFKDFNIERISIEPEVAFPFPWSSEVFFDKMPETVLEEPIALKPISFQLNKYDAIIVGYQPWFLSPSQPITALFANQSFTQLLKDTPVITVIGARNMWINSQESIVKWIKNAGGKLVANIPLIDRVQNHVSAFTILHWMLTGNKTKKWGFLPLPGVSQQDIMEVDQYSSLVAEAISKENYLDLQKNILAKGGIGVEASIVLIEARAKKLFHIWANIIKKKGTSPEARAKWVNNFKWYLVIALFVVSPFIILLYTLLVRPFTISQLKEKKRQILYMGILNNTN